MKILVVDDEAPARDRLRSIIEEIGSLTVVAEASNGSDALAACETHRPDVVLLDIRMPGMDGVEAARHIGELDEPPAVIFTTAYNEYAIEAFEAQAVGYLMKPVRPRRLQRALSAARRLTRPQLAALAESGDEPARRKHICARVRDRLRLIPVDDVRYFQAEHKYVGVGLPGEEILIDESLRSLEEEFGNEMFFRVHRNALIAPRHLEALVKAEDGSFVVAMKGCAKRLAVSRRHASALRKLIRGH